MAEVPVSSAPRREAGLRVGTVFGRSAGVFARHIIPFCLLGALYAAPNLIPAPPGKEVSALAPLLQLLFTPITQAIVVYATFQDLRGRPFAITESFRRGLSRFFPIIGLSICWVIVIVIGFGMLVVPGVLFLTMFLVALPACVVERLGPIESMTRSAELTKGHRWKVLGLLLLLGLAVMVGSFILGAILLLWSGTTASTIGILVLQALFGAYESIIVAVLYSDLRMARDGIDLEQVAAVFD
jgi:hypothetical protein